MSLDTAAGARAPAPLSLQFINIELSPLAGGRIGIAIQATLLDQEELEFIGQDLAQASADNLDEVIAVIRDSASILGPRMDL